MKNQKYWYRDFLDSGFCSTWHLQCQYDNIEIPIPLLLFYRNIADTLFQMCYLKITGNRKLIAFLFCIDCKTGFRCSS